jgi:DNA polymerase III alpha subunit
MLYEFDSWKDLTAREQEYITDMGDYSEYDTLSSCIGHTINNLKINSRRLNTVIDIKQMLDNPPHELKDNIPTIAQNEEKYMSCGLTCNKTDGFEMNFSSSLCKDIAKGTITGKVRLAVQINTVRLYKTKKGKNPGQLMAFLSVEDGSGSIDSVTVFPDCYSQHKDLLVEGNTVLMVGEISKKENTSVIVNKVSQI